MPDPAPAPARRATSPTPGPTSWSAPTAHVLGGCRLAGDTYVGYGLGNFVWYHDRQPDTGVLTLHHGRRRGGRGRVDPRPDRRRPGRPRPLAGAERVAAVDDWRAGRRCTGLAGGVAVERRPRTRRTSRPSGTIDRRPRGADADQSPTRLSGAAQRDCATCSMTYRDFDGRARTGEMVVHRRWPREVRGRLRSSCTTPAGRSRGCGWSTTTGATTTGRWRPTTRRASTVVGSRDRPPGPRTPTARRSTSTRVQNPYVRPGSIEPPTGRRFAGLDRASTAPVPLGVIRAADRPVQAFARIGWEWGGDWLSAKDWQHVAAPDPDAEPLSRAAAPATGSSRGTRSSQDRQTGTRSRGSVTGSACLVGARARMASAAPITASPAHPMPVSCSPTHISWRRRATSACRRPRCSASSTWSTTARCCRSRSISFCPGVRSTSSWASCRSATSRVLYSPLCTSETRWASCFAVELGLLSAQSALGLGDLHALDRCGARSGRTRTLPPWQGRRTAAGQHRRWGRRPTRPSRAGLAGGELVGDRASVGPGPGQAVELGDHEGVAGAAGGEGLTSPGRSRLVPVRPWST